MSVAQIVEDEAPCAAIVEELLRDGEPIGVDMEGLNLSPIGLIQVRQRRGPAYLFRTGINAGLYDKGGLKDLLECPDLTKVMHASTYDCMVSYREGIKMWGIFDTEVASRVLDYQETGVRAHSKPALNDVLRRHGLPVNPVKESFHTGEFSRKALFDSPDPLPKDIMLYAAADVFALVDLYHILNEKLQPDFRRLFDDLNEILLLRPIDEDLTSAWKKVLLRKDFYSLYFTGFKDSVRKADFYSLCSGHEGFRRVLFNGGERKSAIVMSDTREKALEMHSTFTAAGYSFPPEFGEGTEVKLVKPISPKEQSHLAENVQQQRAKLQKENIVVDAGVALTLVKAILKARCPVVVDFHTWDWGVSMDLFAGRYPAVTIALTPDVINKGRVAQLLASREVEKVVFNLSSCYAALRRCVAADQVPANFFDVSVAIQIDELWRRGRSTFQTPSPGARAICMRYCLKIEPARKLGLARLLHMHLSAALPAEMRQFAGQRADAEAQILALHNLQESKAKRQTLRSRFEQHAVHVRLLSGSPSSFKGALTDYLKAKKIPFNSMMVFGNTALVEIVFHPDVRLVTSDLKSAVIGGLRLTATAVEENRAELGVDERRPDFSALELKVSETTKPLESAGFFQLVEELTAANRQ